MPDRTPLHRAMIAAGLTYAGPEAAARVEKALGNDGHHVSAGWRPIETAPKDGRWLLLFERDEIYVARWGTPEPFAGDKTWVTIALGPNPDTYEVDDATHWMPMPVPPDAD